LADVFPELVSDIVRAFGGPPFTDTFQQLLFYGVCPSHGLPCLMTAPPGTPCPAITEVELDGETIALLYLDVDASQSVRTITHVEVLDGRDLGAPDRP